MTAPVCTVCEREYKPLRRGLCHACYERIRVRQIAYGRWQPDRVAAEPVRAHVLALNEAGVSRRQIPILAGVHPKAITTLLRGKRGRTPAVWVTKTTADRILALPIPADPIAVAAAHDLVPALGARRRLRALVAAGWPISHLTAELQMTGSNLGPLLQEQAMVTVRRHRQIVALFNRLQLQPGPSTRARTYAHKRRWPLPMQWDEEDLDDSAATPVCRPRRNGSRPARETDAA
uniref:hypothetical protein n=1 Tax=Nocardia suismassiliense TaxID=2077092 RepID=UPI003F495F2C